MIVTKIETPFRQFLESLKVPNSPNGKGDTLFSPDEINYLTRNSLASAYEFKQEDETDREFYEMFVKWLYEEELDFDYKADAIETPNEFSKKIRYIEEIDRFCKAEDEKYLIWEHKGIPFCDSYVDTYIILYLRNGEHLDDDSFKFLEQTIPNHTGRSHTWLYELNYRMRFRLRIQLIRCLKYDFTRLIKKDIHPIK